MTCKCGIVAATETLFLHKVLMIAQWAYSPDLQLIIMETGF